MSWPWPYYYSPGPSSPPPNRQQPKRKSPPPQTPSAPVSKPSGAAPAAVKASEASAKDSPPSPPLEIIRVPDSGRAIAAQRMYTAPADLQSAPATTQAAIPLGRPQYVRLAPEEGPLGRGHYFISSDGSMEYYAAPAPQYVAARPPSSITPVYSIPLPPARLPALPLHSAFVALYEKITKYDPKGFDDD